MRIYLQIFISTGILLLLSIGCEEVVKEISTFESNNYTIDFTIDPLDKTGYHIFAEKKSESDLDSLLNANGISQDRLKEVHTTEAAIEILHPDATTNFDLLEKLNVTIYTDTLGEKTIASLDPVPHGVTKCTLSLMEDDLKDYLFEPDFILSAVGVLGKRTYDTIPVQVTVKFEYKVGPGQ